MKIVLFGCQQIAVDFLDYLLSQKDVEIPLVVTYELPLDKTYGYESVIERCKERNLNVINPKRITAEVVKKISAVDPDIIFSVYYRRIFPNSLLSVPKLGCVNIHPSLLPFYRGPVPTAWAIKNGEKEFGVTIHKMDKGIDTGDILIQQKFDIPENETGYELYTRGMKIGAELLKKSFRDIVSGKIEQKRQQGLGSYYGKLRGKYLIDWQQKSEDIRNMIRIHARPYNSAETILFNRYVLIDKAVPIYDEKYVLQGVGKIIDIKENDRIVVSCADGCLLLEDYNIYPALTNEEKSIYLKIGNQFV